MTDFDLSKITGNESPLLIEDDKDAAIELQRSALDWSLANGAGLGAHGLARFNQRGEVEALDAPEHLKEMLDVAIERVSRGTAA